MARRRFKWTKEKYRHAASLLRLLKNFQDPPYLPTIVEEYLELWRRHRRGPRPVLVDGCFISDPLLIPIDERLHLYRVDKSIPF
jgi:hypothetical protein